MKTNTSNAQKRVIVDYKNVTPNILQIITDRFPYGYDDEDVVKFQNAKGQTVKSIPLETSGAKYLIKVSVEMDQKIDSFQDDDETLLNNGAPQSEET